jgi:hypothetical protein
MTKENHHTESCAMMSVFMSDESYNRNCLLYNETIDGSDTLLPRPTSQMMWLEISSKKTLTAENCIRLIWISSNLCKYYVKICVALKTLLKTGRSWCCLWDKKYSIGKTATTGIGPLLFESEPWIRKRACKDFHFQVIYISI